MLAKHEGLRKEQGTEAKTLPLHRENRVWGEEKSQSQPCSPIQSPSIWVEDTEDDLGLGWEWELTICLPQPGQSL